MYCVNRYLCNCLVVSCLTICMPLKYKKVTFRIMKGYLLSCKKHPFTTQKATFYKAITKHMDDTHGHRCGYMLWNTKINGR